MVDLLESRTKPSESEQDYTGNVNADMEINPTNNVKNNPFGDIRRDLKTSIATISTKPVYEDKISHEAEGMVCMEAGTQDHKGKPIVTGPKIEITSNPRLCGKDLDRLEVLVDIPKM